MRKLLGIVAISGMLLSFLNLNLEAMESNKKETMQEKSEISFSIKGYDLTGMYKEYYENVDINKINERYKQAAAHYEMDVEIFKGKNFKPREFWEQPISVIFETLTPALNRCYIPYIIGRRYGCFSSSDDEYPGCIETLFERMAVNLINEFMKNNGMKEIDYKEFHNSLHYYHDRELTEEEKLYEKMGLHTGGIRSIPLFDFFEPYFIPNDDNWVAPFDPVAKAKLDLMEAQGAFEHLVKKPFDHINYENLKKKG
ncbi:MAG: hypothetical protein IJ599_02845 [Alphaproteobacteria bacterium]|nr:hypothetical protein [Alphaproteobacteria bacterium]